MVEKSCGGGPSVEIPYDDLGRLRPISLLEPGKVYRCKTVSVMLAIDRNGNARHFENPDPSGVPMNLGDYVAVTVEEGSSKGKIRMVPVPKNEKPASVSPSEYPRYPKI